MLFIREFTVRKHERGILLRNGDFERFLAPAVYRFFDPHRRLEVERFDLTQPAFEHRLADYLVRWQPEAVEDQFLSVETGAGQIAVDLPQRPPVDVRRARSAARCSGRASCA